MTPARKKNLKKLPLVLLLRLPLMLPLLVLFRLGNAAEWLFDILDSHLPGLDTEYELSYMPRTHKNTESDHTDPE